MKYLILVSFQFLVSCVSYSKKEIATQKEVSLEPYRIYLQPFDMESTNTAKLIKDSLTSHFNATVFLFDTTSIPISSYFLPRNRYVADSLLSFLQKKLPCNTKCFVLGITNKDISTFKQGVNNWGIMGLGFQPGKVCIISTYRVYKQKYNLAQNRERMLKVAMHEIGHNMGLKHCTDKHCIMQDAEGGDKLKTEQSYCKECKKHLVNASFLKNE